MIIITSDRKRVVDVGRSDVLYAAYSTAKAFEEGCCHDISKGLDFLKNGTCIGEDGYEVGRQINLIRDYLSRIDPKDAVYDILHPEITAPWNGKLSPVITSCANMFTTADGKDLFYELVSILCYAKVKRANVVAE